MSLLTQIRLRRVLSPFNPEGAAIAAGRVMLTRIKQLIKEKADFGFETTLSTRSYRHLIINAKAAGYKTILIFLWVKSPELAIERIRLRVRKGGHSVPSDVVRRRYKRGLENFFRIFMQRCDLWIINNSKKFLNE